MKFRIVENISGLISIDVLVTLNLDRMVLLM